LSGSTYLDASATNATSVQFLVFGGSFGFNAPVACTASGSAYGWACGWNTTSVPNGSYTLVAQATGPGGTTYSAGVPFKVSNAAPTTSIVLPSPGATLSGSTYLDAAATNATSVQFLVFGGSFGFNAPVACTATGTMYGWLCGWNTTSVPNGSYTLVAQATGPGGSTYSAGVNVTVRN
jgi:chitinase